MCQIVVGILEIIFKIFNIAVMLLALVVIIISSISTNSTAKLMEVMYGDNPPLDPSWISLPVAIVVLGLGFLGCCGVRCGIKIFLLVYAIVMLIIFIGTIGFTTATGVSSHTETKDKIRQSVNASFIAGVAKEDVRDKFNSLQKKLECCGSNSVEDYNNYGYGGKIPSSCCSKSPCDAGNAYKTGCVEASVNYFESCIKKICITLLCFCAIVGVCSALGFLFACR